MAAAVGSSVDPDPLPSRRRLRDLLDLMKLDKDCTEDAKARIVETGVQHFLDRVKLIKGRIALERDYGNLSSDLLKAARCPNEKDRERKLRSVQKDFARYQDEQTRLVVDENEIASEVTWGHSRFHTDPDSFEAKKQRNSLKEKAGDNFNGMAYDIINMIPDDAWMEFVRNALKVEESSEEMIRLHSSVSREGKYQMIKDWRRRMLRAGQDASAERLLNLAIDFMMRKRGAGKIVQQNFNGTINANHFNAYAGDGKGRPVQASA